MIIYDREADKRKQEFLERYPKFTEYCKLETVQIEANNPQLITKLVETLEKPDTLNTIVLCFDNKINNLLLGFQLDKIKLKSRLIHSRFLSELMTMDPLTDSPVKSSLTGYLQKYAQKR